MSESSSVSRSISMRHGDRLIGAVVVVFALIIWFFVIPAQVDSASYGWMRPRTLPMTATALMGGFGALLVIFPAARKPSISWALTLRVLGVISLTAIAVFAMAQWGFLAVAPMLALILTLLVGERRPAWIAAAVVGAPFVIWFIVSVLLVRPLP